MKTRKQKEIEYVNKFGDIPTDYYDRLKYMCNNISPSKYSEILNIRDNLLSNMYYTDFKLVLYELPEGAVRPKFRLINRKNFANAAIQASSFVHVYSPNADEDSRRMKRMTESNLIELDFQNNNSLIATPCIVTYNTYFKTPSNYNITETLLSEIGLYRHTVKPDFDNIAKKYSDMTNERIWLDDAMVVSGTINKFYSILPRIEINIKYLNALYNKKQYNSMISRKDFNKHNLNIGYFDNKGGIWNEHD